MTSEPILPELVLSRERDLALIRRLNRSGRLAAIRRGAYAVVGLPDKLEERIARVHLHIQAVHRMTRQPLWFSQQSAALIWGLPTLVLPDVTHVIQENRPSGWADASVQRHVMALPQSDRDVCAGLPVTTLERTVLDCARLCRFTEAIVILDGFANRGGSTQALLERLKTMPGQRGVRLARQRIELSDGGAQSPGETRLRLALGRGGLPPVQTQIPVQTHLGLFYLDMGWPQYRFGIEYDGMLKYTRLADGSPSSVVFEEKRRQDALEAAGWTIHRVTAADLRTREELVALIEERLRRAALR